MGMVTWNAHRILGDLLCSFHSSEIDRLIDFDKSHDPSRYNVDALLQGGLRERRLI